jgi:hypothetical protein
MKIYTLLKVAFLLLYVVNLNGQDGEHPHSPDHHHRHHEIGIGTGPVLLPEESVWGFGLHLHALAGINEWLGAGMGYELIVGEHQHHTVSGLVHFHPFHPLDINVGPGLVFPDNENSQYRLKFHAEITAAFELGEHLHLGPSIDTGIGKQDLHITFGVHVGYVFGFKR